MSGPRSFDTAAEAAAFIRGVSALPHPTTPLVRALRRELSGRLRGVDAETVHRFARALVEDAPSLRWAACEAIAAHRPAYALLDRTRLERLGAGMDSWHAVDGFARTLSGPAWRDGLIDTATVHAWARSADRWWRRAALVSTVALNVRTHGGRGDAPRTLAVCGMLAEDRDDMVVKALSWALRALVVHDAERVDGFLRRHERVLAARAVREVRNKLETGRKNPRRSARGSIHRPIG